MRQQHVGPLPCANNTAWLKKIFFIPQTAFVPLPLVNSNKDGCVVMGASSGIFFNLKELFCNYHVVLTDYADIFA